MNKIYFPLSLLAVMLLYFQVGVAMQNSTTTNTTEMPKKIESNKRVFSDLDDEENDLSIVSEDEVVEIDAPIAKGSIKVPSNPPSLVPDPTPQIKKRRTDSSVGLNSTVSPVGQPAQTCSSKLLMPTVSSVPQATTSLVSTNKSLNGMTLLHKAVLEENIGAIDFLGKNQKSLLEAIDIDGETPLLLAARLGKIGAVKKLLELKADFWAKCKKNGGNVLHSAALSDYPEMIAFVVEKDKKLLAVPSNSGLFPLGVALCFGKINAVKKLVELGADLQARDQWNITALHYGVISDNSELIAYIVGKDRTLLEAKTQEGETPLLTAARVGKCEALKKLIELGADVFAVDSNGNTALHLATIEKKYDIISRLSPFLPITTTPVVEFVKMALLHCSINSQGKTALQLAVEKNIDLEKKNALSSQQLIGDKTNKN